MKITEIYISAFGGIKDLTLKLDGNLNVIYGENENGKTTVMAFIKAVFYGTGKKTQDIESSPRVRYAPFDGSSMGGRIYYVKDGKRYCIERQFLKSDSTDKITLTDMDTGETFAETSDIGFKVFGIGADAFSGSMFIGADKSGLINTTASGELNSKLSSLALTGDENTSYQLVEDRIVSAKEKLVSKSGRTGSLVKKKAEFSELSERLNKAQDDAKRKAEIVALKEKYNNEGLEIAKKYEKIKQLTDRKDDIKNTEKIKKYLALKAELDEINKTLTAPNGTVVDSAFVSKIKFCMAKISAQKEKCETVKTDIAQIEKSLQMSENMSSEEARKKLEYKKADAEKANAEYSEILKMSEDLKKETESKTNELETAKTAKKKFNPVLFVLGLVFAVTGVAAGAVINPLFFVSAGAGLVLFALSFVFKPADLSRMQKLSSEINEINAKRTDISIKLSETSAKLNAANSEINMLIGVINADENLKKQRAEELESKRTKLSEEEEKLNVLQEEFKTLACGMDTENINLDELEKNAETQKAKKLELNILSKDLGNISYREAEKKLQNTENSNEYENIDFDAAEKQKELLGEKMTELKQKITALDTELKTSFRGFVEPEIIEREISALSEKIAQGEEFVCACDAALEVLSSSFADVRRGYGSVLDDKMKEYFSLLTDGKYKNASVDKSFGIRVEEKDVFGMHETAYLSTGTAEQAYLSLRLAICNLISESESVPVMLDDALSNYDDKRTDKALEFLNDFAKENQVILFTCHKSVAESAQKLGVQSKNLR